MAAYTNSEVQTVAPNTAAIFTETLVPSYDRAVRFREGTGAFLLSGNMGTPTGCCRSSSTVYDISFGANIAVAEGGTPAPISVGIAVDGTVIPASIMTVTPTVAEAYFNVSRQLPIDIWMGCCQSVSIVNLSDQPILMQNASIDIRE